MYSGSGLLAEDTADHCNAWEERIDLTAHLPSCQVQQQKRIVLSDRQLVNLRYLRSDV